MSPEANLPPAGLLEESMRIKDVLLDVQEQVQLQAMAVEAQLLHGVRDQLGYDVPAENVVEDLVDARIDSKSLFI
jgi:hypothetical protein